MKTVFFQMGLTIGMALQAALHSARDSEVDLGLPPEYAKGVRGGADATTTVIDRALHEFVDKMLSNGFKEEADGFIKGMNEGINKANLTDDQRTSAKVAADGPEDAPITPEQMAKLKEVLSFLGFKDIQISIGKEG